ncbi:MAG: DUF485 domain-containing protein [Afipia sp.]|nr:DUF485 domain-containing protein [Afipia sp.]
MSQLSPEQARKVMASKNFRELVSARARLRWVLSGLTLVMFFGFLVLISSTPKSLGASIPGSAIPISMALAMGVIVSVLCLTGFYVRRSNSRFDNLAQSIKQEFGR